MYEEERTVDIMLLLVEILRKIGIIFLWAALFAIIIGGVAAYRGYRAMGEAKNRIAEGSDLVVSDEARKQYDEALRLYEQQYESLNTQLDDIMAQISAKEESESDSFILSTRPEDYYKETVIYYVDTHYTVNTNGGEQQQNPINSIMQAYRVLIINDAFFSYLKENLSEEIDIADIKKLVQLDIDMDSAFLQLFVCGKTRKQADEILSLSAAYVEGSFDKISAAIGPYDIKVVETLGNSGEGIRGATEGVEEAWSVYLGELSASEEAIKERISALIKPEEPQPEVARKETTSLGALIRGAIKRSLLGGFIGAFLSIAYISVSFIMRDNALSEDELRNRFGLVVLSSAKRFSARKKWQKFLGKLAGDDKRVDGVEETALLATVNVSSILKATNREHEEILMVGRNRNMLVELSCLMYGINVIAAGDILVDRHAVEMLDDYTTVIIAEGKEDISYSEIGRECEKLKLLNKDIIGIVAL
jgi:hypothetical protein